MKSPEQIISIIETYKKSNEQLREAFKRVGTPVDILDGISRTLNTILDLIKDDNYNPK